LLNRKQSHKHNNHRYNDGQNRPVNESFKHI
jgi:hypothetical protein